MRDRLIALGVIGAFCLVMYVVFLYYPIWQIDTKDIVRVEYHEWAQESEDITDEFIIHEIDLDEGVTLLKEIKKNSVRYTGIINENYWVSSAKLYFYYENGDVLKLDHQGGHYILQGTGISTNIKIKDEVTSKIYNLLKE